MQQSKLESLVETGLNIGSGFFLSMAVWEWVVRPIIERGYLTLDDAFLITCIFTVTSVIRSYIWRRAFNAKLLHKYITIWKQSASTVCRRWKTGVQKDSIQT